MEFEPVIGLEVHAQLNTKTKIFCNCSVKYGATANTQTCPVCLGLPGVLPVLNKEVIRSAVITGLALNCSISSFSKFDRKNYFYPDLPKSYQISQYDKPLTENGYIDVNLGDRKKQIRIKRAHLEEDAGKLVHSEKGNESYVDFNRCGTPLLEIVTEPDIDSPLEAYEYLITLKQILKYLNVSDCNMEEGSLRCDANISLRPKGTKKLGTKAELKNMNSFKGVEKALNYEVKRQMKLLKEGKTIVQETRLWNADKECSFSMRSKEEVHDYRYFPEPDLVPVVISNELINDIKERLPELPNVRKERFISSCNIPEYDAQVLTSDKNLADYFEDTKKEGGSPKLLSNWIMSELLRELNAGNITAEKSPVSPQNLSKLIQLIENGKITGKIAKSVFDEMYKTTKDPETIIKEKNLSQIDNESELNAIIDKAISENQKSVNDFKNGKKNALMYIVGQIMKISRGKANPGKVQDILIEKLS